MSTSTKVLLFFLVFLGVIVIGEAVYLFFFSHTNPQPSLNQNPQVITQKRKLTQKPLLLQGNQMFTTKEASKSGEFYSEGIKHTVFMLRSRTNITFTAQVEDLSNGKSKRSFGGVGISETVKENPRRILVMYVGGNWKAKFEDGKIYGKEAPTIADFPTLTQKKVTFEVNLNPDGKTGYMGNEIVGKKNFILSTSLFQTKQKTLGIGIFSFDQAKVTLSSYTISEK